jgi:hypothetical protein
MKTLTLVCCLPLFIFAETPLTQKPPVQPQKTLRQTTICEILKAPSAFNNDFVQVRGTVRASFEYSVLADESCPGEGIWFVFGDGSIPPGVTAYVIGRNPTGGRDSKGHAIPSTPVRLVKDSNFDELIKLLNDSQRAESCAEGPPPDFPPPCISHRIVATFVGRIDSVSKELHAAHKKRKSEDRIDGNGFGHMGMFDAQIVVQSVEKVVAVEEGK